MSEFTLLLGLIFSFIYFGVNFYIGYKYKLKFIDSLIVGIMGSGMGIFLISFSFYAEFILKMPNFANWIAIPYFIPTMSIVKLFSININYLYAPVLMIINIILFLQFTTMMVIHYCLKDTVVMYLHLKKPIICIQIN